MNSGLFHGTVFTTCAAIYSLNLGESGWGAGIFFPPWNWINSETLIEFSFTVVQYNNRNLCEDRWSTAAHGNSTRTDSPNGLCQCLKRTFWTTQTRLQLYALCWDHASARKLNWCWMEFLSPRFCRIGKGICVKIRLWMLLDRAHKHLPMLHGDSGGWRLYIQLCGPLGVRDPDYNLVLSLVTI